MHEVDRIARLESAFHHANLKDHASILIKSRIEHQRLQRRIRIALGSRQLFNNARQHVIDADVILGGNRNRLERIEPQFGINRLLCTFDIGRWKINFVDHRQQGQVVFQRQVEIGDRLRFDPLRRIDNDQRAFARHQRSPHFVRKINVARCIDQIQQIFCSIRSLVIERNRITLDGNAPFTLDIHRVEHLFMQVALRNASAGLNQSVGESRLAVIDVGNNTEVSNVFHSSDFSRKQPAQPTEQSHRQALPCCSSLFRRAVVLPTVPADTRINGPPIVHRPVLQSLRLERAAMDWM